MYFTEKVYEKEEGSEWENLKGETLKPVFKFPY